MTAGTIPAKLTIVGIFATVTIAAGAELCFYIAYWTVVTVMAVELFVLAINLKSGLTIMIKTPYAPAIGIMTYPAISTQLLFMDIIVFVTGITIFICILVTTA